jgi:cyclopropane fatty-acyl-phospholipid synthase-like methyltransferase
MEGTTVSDTSAGDSHRRAAWESRWSRPGFEPKFRIDWIPVEISAAVEEEWFPPGAAVLDIGCGSGEIAAWLAARGYDVLGVDFAESAIAKAKSTYQDAPGLAFEVADICEAAPRLDAFGVLVDRGCLQGIAPEVAPDYVPSVASAAKAGARFLLFHRIHRGSAEETARSIESLCRDSFELLRVAETEMARDPTGGRTVRGVVCWLVRTG